MRSMGGGRREERSTCKEHIGGGKVRWAPGYSCAPDLQVSQSTFPRTCRARTAGQWMSCLHHQYQLLCWGGKFNASFERVAGVIGMLRLTNRGFSRLVSYSEHTLRPYTPRPHTLSQTAPPACTYRHTDTYPCQRPPRPESCGDLPSSFGSTGSTVGRRAPKPGSWP